LVTSGSAGNNASNFSLTYFPSGTSTASNTVTVVLASSGGAEKESESKIKLNAINSYNTQNRAVVSSDYQSLILSGGFDVSDVFTWGGEDNTPPKFGYVMICAKPTSGDVISSTQQTLITELLRAKAVGNTKFQFVNPEFVDLKVSSRVVYDKNIINISVGELEAAVKNTIYNYGQSNLSTFGDSFRLSNLMTKIDATDASIVNNLSLVSLEKNISPVTYTDYFVNFSFVNGITSLYSTYFTADIENLFLEDNGAGAINVVHYVGTNKIIHKPNVGSVDYATGEVTINSLNVVRYANDVFKIVAACTSQDVVSSKNILLRIPKENITITSVKY